MSSGYTTTYKIYSDKNKVLKDRENTACFSALHSEYFEYPKNSFIVFKVYKKHASLLGDQETQIINWYIENLNNIGLACSLKPRPSNKSDYYFQVNHLGNENYITFLATLVALRYLDEGNLYKLVKWAFENRDKNFDFFTLFQLMHFSYGEWNCNHTFLPGPNNFLYYQISPLITYKEFIINLKDYNKIYKIGDYATRTNKLFCKKGVSLDKGKLQTEKLCIALKDGDIQKGKNILDFCPTIPFKE